MTSLLASTKKEKSQLRSDWVFETLRQSILSNEIPPGTPLTELGIANDLKVSRTPIREALRRLASEDLIEIVPNQGTYARGITEEDILEIYMIREALEGMCARNTCMAISGENLDSLYADLENARLHYTNNEYDKAFEEGDRIHRVTLAMGGNKRIRKIVDNIGDYTATLHRMSVKIPGRFEQSLNEHRAVLDAFQAKDEALSEEAMRTHIRSTRDDVLQAARNVRAGSLIS